MSCRRCPAFAIQQDTVRSPTPGYAKSKTRKEDMKINIASLSGLVALSGFIALASGPFAQAAPAAEAYKIIKTTQTMGTGGIDYVYADNDGRRLYVPRGGEVLVFDLDTLKSAGTIPNARARGAAVDPKSHHGFCSSSPVVMWDTKTLETIKTIEVQGRPDGIIFEPLTERIYVLSHSQPNATVIDAKDGSVVGTIDLGGAPEQAASDGQGHLHVDLEDKENKPTSYEVGQTVQTKPRAKTCTLDTKNDRIVLIATEPAPATAKEGAQ